jgi:hypothetical protein
MELFNSFIGNIWILDAKEIANASLAVRLSMGDYLSNKVKTGGYEHESLEIVGKYIQPNDTCMIVGANIGVYSVFVAQKANKGIVYSFEPNFEIYEVLAKNSILYKNIKPFNFGLYNANCEVDYRGLHFKVVVGDTFLQHIEKVAFIKIDVEGAEVGVIQGLQNIIRENSRLVMLCEFSKVHYELTGFTMEQFFDLVESLGFQYGRIYKGIVDLENNKEQLMEVAINQHWNLLLWKGLEPFWK